MTGQAITAAPSSGDITSFVGLVEQYPVASLTLTGAALGVLFGSLFGAAYAGIFGGSMEDSIVKSGGVWGAIFALKGFDEGRNLESWLRG